MGKIGESKNHPQILFRQKWGILGKCGEPPAAAGDRRAVLRKRLGRKPFGGRTPPRAVLRWSRMQIPLTLRRAPKYHRQANNNRSEPDDVGAASRRAGSGGITHDIYGRAYHDKEYTKPNLLA